MTHSRRSWWDLRAAWIVFWRIRGMVCRNGNASLDARWWEGWPATFRTWWRMGHGRNLVS